MLVTQYNNTTVTRTTTIHQDLASINISTLSDVQSTAFEVLTAIDPEYEANGFALNNGTNAFVDGTFSVAYPTPFIGIQGFEFITVTQQDSKCPNGLQYAGRNLGTVECACMMQTYMDDPNLLDNTATSQVTLSSTYYEIGNTQPVNNDLGTHLEGPIPINNVSYSNFIESVLGSESFNKYRSCVFLDVGLGPPALMIPVSALTATTTATVKGAGNYGIQSPKPGNPIAPVVPAATTTSTVPPSVPLVQPKPDMGYSTTRSTAPNAASETAIPVAVPPVPIVNKPSSTQNSANIPVTESIKVGPGTPVGSPSEGSDTDQSGSNGGQNAVGPSDAGNNDKQNIGSQGDNSNSESSDTGDIKSVPVPAAAILYQGSSITPDTSSQYHIPQVGKLSPGGPPITTNNVVYYLVPSATALVSNGQMIPLPKNTVAAPIPSKQNAAPALTFAGSTYTADSSNIIIAGQTLAPGGPAVTVSNTPISLAPSASIAVVGGTTQSLYPVAPTAHPAMTFAGSTYTANSDSAILIQGQTLIPGSPAITISNTPISLAPGASVAVIAGQTQTLTSMGRPTARPVLSFAGSTYTANTAAAFIIDGQTLPPGSVITVSNTPISLATDGSFALIAGSSTQSLPAPTTPPAFTFTFNGTTYTADSTDSEFIIAGQTLRQGGAVTVSGTPISYYASGGGGRDVVVGSTSAEAVGSGLGGLIMSGFGGGGGVRTGTAEFTGGAVKSGVGFGWWVVWGFIMGWMVLLGTS